VCSIDETKREEGGGREEKGRGRRRRSGRKAK
jgi:hypothetical protein